MLGQTGGSGLICSSHGPEDRAQARRIFSVLSICTTRPSWMINWTTPNRTLSTASWIASRGNEDETGAAAEVWDRVLSFIGLPARSRSQGARAHLPEVSNVG